MSISKRSYYLFWACIVTASAGILLVAIISGAQHETRKFKTLLMTIFVVSLIAFLIYDQIYFVILTSIKICIGIRENQHDAYGQYEADFRPNRSDFLRLRIESLRAQMKLRPKHRIEAQNLYYKDVCWDLWLYTRYFVLLLLVIVGSRDPLAYYNTKVKSAVLLENRLGSFGVKKIKKIEDFYDFTQLILIDAFSEGKNYRGELINEPGWINLEIAKLLGVVRLRQLRYTSKIKGLGETKFTEEPFLPAWSLPYIAYHYLSKYWRIYDPWVTMSEQTFSLLLPVFYLGNVHDYPEHTGYVAVLGRNKQNSMQVLNFLRENNWVDDKTSAIFIDFTLYNVDANMFSIVNIMLENTPFGGVLSRVEVDSAELLYNLDMLTYWGLLVLALYIAMLIQLTKVLILKVYHDKRFFYSSWNIADCAILMLNGLLLFMIFVRELYVKQLLQILENSDKLVFVDFRKPGQIDYLTLIVASVLICLTTLRLWKVLQFAAPFMIFTKTLASACPSLAAVIGIILMFLSAFCLSSFIINSNNSEIFQRVIRSFTAVMCFSFGFKSEANPKELNYGGTWLGTAFYMVLMISVSIFLINIFLTLIANYCSRAKDILFQYLQTLRGRHLSFPSFLAKEYRWLLKYPKRLIKPEESNSDDLDIQATLNALRRLRGLRESIEITKDIEESSSSDSENMKTDILSIHREQKAIERVEKFRLVGLILRDQMELLEREQTKMEIVTESSDDESFASGSQKSKNYEMIAVAKLLLLTIKLDFLLDVVVFCQI